MNVADKQGFYTEIARRLRPGARLVVFEVCRSRDARGELPLPLPWSLDGTDSHLATADELRDAIQAGGFTVLDWTDESAWLRQWFDDFGRRLAAGSAKAGLSQLLTDGTARLLNFAAAVAAGELTVHRGVFAATPGQ
jgi:SAM-dependent methyltransferase